MTEDFNNVIHSTEKAQYGRDGDNYWYVLNGKKRVFHIDGGRVIYNDDV